MSGAAGVGLAGVAPLFLTPQEVAGILDTNRGGLRDLRDAGKGPAYFTIGSAIRYHPADVEAWRAEVRDRDRSR